MFATISSGFHLPLRGKWDQQQPPKPDVDAVFARLARCVFKVFLDTRLACAFTPLKLMFERSTSFDQSGWNKILDRIWYTIFCWSRSVSQATPLHLSHQLQRHLPKASLGDPNDFLGGGASASKLMTSWSNSKKSWENNASSKSTKSGQNTQSSLVSLIFLFQKQGRNSVNGWLVSQVGSRVYLPKEAMMNKSMSLWGNAMCDVGGRGCICNICCKRWDVNSQLVLAQFLNQQ